MASLIIDNLDDDFTDRLRQRAASHGRSVEDEALKILQRALVDKPRLTGADLADSIRAKFAPFGGVDLEIPPRNSMREPPRFDE